MLSSLIRSLSAMTFTLPQNEQSNQASLSDISFSTTSSPSQLPSEPSPAATSSTSSSGSSGSPSRKPNKLSSFIGTAGGILTEQALLYPLEVAAKRNMNDSKLKNFSIFSYYNAFWASFLKKFPMREYKYFSYDQLVQLFKNKEQPYHQFFVDTFGEEYAELFMVSVAGGITGAGEVALFNWYDTLVIREQARNKVEGAAKVSYLQDAKQLGVKGVYRGSVATFFRNIPGAASFFGGSVYFNQKLDNADKKDKFKDLLAKWFASVFSLIVSHPQDVVKTRMQIRQQSYSEIFSDLAPKDFLKGFDKKFVLSFKLAFGFFVIERLNHKCTDYFGTPVVEASELSDLDPIQASPSLVWGTVQQYSEAKAKRRVFEADDLTADNESDLHELSSSTSNLKI